MNLVTQFAAEYLQIMFRAVTDAQLPENLALIASAFVIGQISGLGVFYRMNASTVRAVGMSKTLIWRPGSVTGFGAVYIGLVCATGTGIETSLAWGVSYDAYIWTVGLLGTALILPVMMLCMLAFASFLLFLDQLFTSSKKPSALLLSI